MLGGPSLRWQTGADEGWVSLVRARRGRDQRTMSLKEFYSGLIQRASSARDCVVFPGFAMHFRRMVDAVHNMINLRNAALWLLCWCSGTSVLFSQNPVS